MKAAVLYIETGLQTEDNRLVYAKACSVLSSHGAEVIDGNRLACLIEVENRIPELLNAKPDFLLLVVLTGRSAPVIEAVGKMSTIPLIIWAIGANFSFPSSALACGVLKEEGCLYKLVHGEPENENTVSEVMDAICASYAVTRLKRSKMGLIGGLFFNLVSCVYDPAVIHEKFGTGLIPVPYTDLQSLLADDTIIDGDHLKSLENRCCSHDLRVPPELLVPGLKLHMVLLHLATKHSFDAYAIECWSGLPNAIGLNPCMGFMEDSYIIACEGDAVMGIMLLAVKYMTGRIPFACDIQNIDDSNIITVSHCGASSSLAVNGDVILDMSQVAQKQGFNTIVCRPELEKGFVTMVRLYGKRFEYMHIACGELIACDRFDSFTVSIRLTGSRTGFIEECSGNHYIVVSGDIREKLRLFCKWLHISIKET